ncbi:hypothetical protein C8A05DRAFT_33951 [Staphylotrichum tortipilum]|uniref:Putative gamma-glutamylcyclotransferase n=1 Tax=Staphylotrichum tortipilum TaxID=2831512 RepID=A0AAN6RUA9_9PEZI|nr:hypothetical protein C8A05DRAFT_33951 [Staphylotrichum longicolle]
MPNGLVLEKPKPQPYIYEPHYYFFYGTLMKPDVLKGVLGLPSSVEPVLRPAKVYGYELTNWGQYKALVEGVPGTTVAGYAYFVESAEHEYKLAYYETNAYQLAPCNVYFTDGGPDGCTEDERPTPGYTFKYAGDAQALKAGRFDRALWEMQMGMRLPPGWSRDGESG